MQNIRLCDEKEILTSAEFNYELISAEFFQVLSAYSHKPKIERPLWALMKVMGLLEINDRAREMLFGMAVGGITQKNHANIIRLLMLLPKEDFSKVRVRICRQENVGYMLIELWESESPNRTSAWNRRTTRVFDRIGKTISAIPIQYSPLFWGKKNVRHPEPNITFAFTLQPALATEDCILGNSRRNSLVPTATNVGVSQITFKLSDLEELQSKHISVYQFLDGLFAKGYDEGTQGYTPMRVDQSLLGYIEQHVGPAGLRRLMLTVQMNIALSVKVYECLVLRLVSEDIGSNHVKFSLNVFPAVRVKTIVQADSESVENFDKEYTKFYELNKEPASAFLCFYHKAIYTQPNQSENNMPIQSAQNTPISKFTWNDECSLYRRFQGKLISAIAADDGFLKSFQDVFMDSSLDVSFKPVKNSGVGIKSNHRTMCVTICMKTGYQLFQTAPSLQSVAGKMVDFFVGKMRSAGHDTATKTKSNASALAYFDPGSGFVCCKFYESSNIPAVMDVGCDLKTANFHWGAGKPVGVEITFYYREWVKGSDNGVEKALPENIADRMFVGSHIARSDIGKLGLTKRDVDVVTAHVVQGDVPSKRSEIEELRMHSKFQINSYNNILVGLTIGEVLNGPAYVVGGMEQYKQYVQRKEQA